MTKLFGSLDFKITKRTNIKKITRGNIALTPPIISAKGVLLILEISFVFKLSVTENKTPEVPAVAAISPGFKTFKERALFG